MTATGFYGEPLDAPDQFDFDQAESRIVEGYTGPPTPGETGHIDLKDVQGSAAAIERKVRQEDNDRGVNTALKSASQVPLLYAAPVAGKNIRPVDGERVKPYDHYEPSEEEAVAAYLAMVEGSKHKDSLLAAAEDIADRGRKSPAYKRYADVTWQAVAAIAGAPDSPQQAFRMEYLSAQEAEDLAMRHPSMSAPGSWAGSAEASLQDFIDSSTFGLGMAAIRWARPDERGESFVGHKLQQGGWGVGTPRDDALNRGQSNTAAIASNVLGVMNPGGLSHQVAKRSAQWAFKKGAKSAGARLAYNAAADFGLDASSSMLRQAMERASRGAELGGLDAAEIVGQGVAEGLVGGVVGGSANLLAEGAAGMRKSFFRTNVGKEHQALDAIGMGAPLSDKKTGRRGVLTRAWNALSEDREGGLAGLKQGFKRTDPTPKRVADGLIEDAADRAGRTINDTDIEGSGTIGYEAARQVAEELGPTVNKKARLLAEQITQADAEYFGRPGVIGVKKPVNETFKVLSRLWKSSHRSSGDVRRSAGEALVNISDITVVNSKEAAKAAEARSGALWLSVDDPRISGSMRSRVSDALAAFERSDVSARAGRAPGPDKPAETMSVLPFGKKKPPVGTTMGGYALGSYTDAPARRPASTERYVVFKPLHMDAAGYSKALRSLDARVSYGGQNESAPEIVREAAESLRLDRAQFPGLEAHTAKNRRLITKMEGLKDFSRMNERQLSGTAVDPEQLGTIEDMSIDQIIGSLENIYAGSNQRGSERFAMFLEDPKLVKRLRAVRAAHALQALEGGGDETIRGGMSSSGPFGFISDVSTFAQSKLYGPGGVLVRLYESGELPKRLNILMDPDTVKFLTGTSGDTLNALYSDYLASDAARDKDPQ
jgi:hypothetical protein